MTRDEYLNELKGRLTSLTDEEKAEALQYYSDYFEDANDDERIIRELGTPEETAKTIMEKFSNALTETKKVQDENDSTENYKDNLFLDECCWSYEKEKINCVSLNLGACHTVVIPGNKWMIETRGMREETITCKVKDGTLIFNNIQKMKLFDFFSHERKTRLTPRILITIPANAVLDEFTLKLGAGLFTTKDLALSSKKTKISVGAGSVEIKGLSSEQSGFQCGMGNISIIGNLTGRTNIDCGMGSVKLELNGEENSYSYDCKVGLGDFRFNSKKFSGVQTVLPEDRKDNHLSVNVGMGSVTCKTNK